MKKRTVFIPRALMTLALIACPNPVIPTEGCQTVLPAEADAAAAREDFVWGIVPVGFR